MEAIKKKMQAMKVEKDNLMDRCDACEQVLKHENWISYNVIPPKSCRDAKLRREKTEEEVNELQNKAKTLEVTRQLRSDSWNILLNYLINTRGQLTDLLLYFYWISEILKVELY